MMIKAAIHKIETFLWRSGMHHPQVRMTLCALVCFAGMALVLGALLSPLTVWPLWFAVGVVIFANVFWGLARHLMRAVITAYSSGLLFSLLVRSGIRLLLTAGLLYVALIVCHAPVTALAGGVVVGTGVTMGAYALALRSA